MGPKGAVEILFKDEIARADDPAAATARLIDEYTRQFAHPSTMILITPQGKVARYFPGIEYPPRDVRLALIEASQNQIGSLADRVFLLCFHYNPQTGRYALLITRTMQVAGIGTALAVGAYIALNVRRERRLGS